MFIHSLISLFKIPDSFIFYNDSIIFLSNLILIITSLAIHYSKNVFRGFFYLGVHRGTAVFWCLFFSLLFSSVTRTLRSLHACLRLNEKRLKIACSADPGLLNETKSLWFPLSCLSLYQNGR